MALKVKTKYVTWNSIPTVGIIFPKAHEEKQFPPKHSSPAWAGLVPMETEMNFCPTAAPGLSSHSLLCSNNINLFYCLEIYKFKLASLSPVTIRSPDMVASVILSREITQCLCCSKGMGGGWAKNWHHPIPVNFSIATPSAPSLSLKSNKANHSILVCPFPLHYIKLATDGMPGLTLQNSPVPTPFHQAGS